MKATRKNKRPALTAKPHLILQTYGLLLLLLAFAALSLLFLTTTSSSSQQHNRRLISHHLSPTHCSTKTSNLGEFGDMMLSLLPNDLAFTVFVPSPQAFRRVLHLQPTDANNTYAIVSRVLGFSATPQHLPSAEVPLHKHMTLPDSLSGLKLYAWRDSDGALLVNGVRSECVDIRKANVIVHLMSGILMDAEFQQSFSSDYVH